MRDHKLKIGDESYPMYSMQTLIVGSGAAGLNAAAVLYKEGQSDIAILTEGRAMGTSRNTGSDKQTYYKLTTCGGEPDSIRKMAQTLFDSTAMDGDLALAEAALSIRGFCHLVDIGVPFPCNGSGEYVGYKTDHDPNQRGTSAGPLTSKFMTEALWKEVERFHIRHGRRGWNVRYLSLSRQPDRRDWDSPAGWGRRKESDGIPIRDCFHQIPLESLRDISAGHTVQSLVFGKELVYIIFK